MRSKQVLGLHEAKAPRGMNTWSARLHDCAVCYDNNIKIVIMKRKMIMTIKVTTIMIIMMIMILMI